MKNILYPYQKTSKTDYLAIAVILGVVLLWKMAS